MAFPVYLLEDDISEHGLLQSALNDLPHPRISLDCIFLPLDLCDCFDRIQAVAMRGEAFLCVVDHLLVEGDADKAELDRSASRLLDVYRPGDWSYADERLRYLHGYVFLRVCLAALPAAKESFLVHSGHLTAPLQERMQTLGVFFQPKGWRSTRKVADEIHRRLKGPL